jgi:hypothetical protein
MINKKEGMRTVLVYAFIIFCLILMAICLTMYEKGKAAHTPGDLDGQVVITFHGEFYQIHQKGEMISLSWVTPKTAIKLLEEDKEASKDLAEKLGVYNEY